MIDRVANVIGHDVTDHASAALGAVHTKRTLLSVSHAIERFALATGGPTAVIALFQRSTYALAEVDRYRRIAERATTVVGVAEEFPPRLPPGVGHVLIAPDEHLAREWSVTVLSPEVGATLVAHDLEALGPHARTLESGRLFHGGWSFRREHAYAEVLRLRGALGERFAPEVAAALDDLLTRVIQVPGRPSESAPDAAVADLSLALERAQLENARLLDRIGDDREHDPRSGLPTAAFLFRWVGRSAGGTLPVGLVAVRVPALGRLLEQLGPRAELSILLGLARLLRARLDDTAHAVRLGRQDFLLVLPARDDRHVQHVRRALTAEVTELERAFPFVPIECHTACTVTRDRPLPVAQLFAVLDGRAAAPA